MIKEAVMGPIKVSCTRELAEVSFGYVRSDINDIKNQYIRLGFHLHEILSMKYYADFGYKDFYEFCEKNFSLDKSAVSRVMNVWEAFAAYDDCNYSRKMFIDEKYRDYSYSQLVEMLPLEEKQRREIKPDMSVSAIRIYKKGLKENKQKIKAGYMRCSAFQANKTCEGCYYMEHGNCPYGVSDDKEEVQTPEPVATSQLEAVEEAAVDEPVATSQPEKPEFPVLQNERERRDFVDNYKSWAIWCRNEQTEDVYYRYDLPDGTAIVVRNYPVYVEWEKKDIECNEFFLLEPGYHHFTDCKSNMTLIIAYLKKLKTLKTPGEQDRREHI